MDLEIKTEQQTAKCCIACLREDVDLIGEDSIVSETTAVYKKLVSEEIHNLDDLAIELCNFCLKALNDIEEFRVTCLNSIEFLSRKYILKGSDDTDAFSMDLNLDVEPVKDEEVLFVDSFPVKVEVSEERRESRRLKQDRQKHAVSTIDDDIPSVGKKEKKKIKKRVEKSDVTETGKREAAYCSLCCEYYQRNINGHIMENHATKTLDDQFRCNICEEVVKSEQQLTTHFDAHRDYDRPKKCSKCDATYKNRKEYRNHVKTHITKDFTTRVYACEYCEVVYRSSTNLKYHVMIKHQGALCCKYCHKGFFDQDEFDKHIKWEEEKISERKFYCDFCGYASKWKAALWDHLKKYHTPNSPMFICNECGKTYKTKTQFRSHQVNSHLEKTIQCSDCGKKFAFGTHLRKHIKLYHSETGMFDECKVCGKKMKASSMRIHMSAVHQQIRKWACDECDMTFKTSGSLRKHKHTHSKTRPFNCTMCTTGYYQNEYLRKHYDRVHGIVYTGEDIRKICGKRSLECYNNRLTAGDAPSTQFVR